MRLGLGLGLNQQQGGGGVAIPWLIQAVAADWDGSQLVATGATFTQATPGFRPTVAGDGLVFDGTDDVIVATVSQDWADKTLMWVATPGTTDNAQDAIISATGPASLTFNIDGQNIGVFNSRLRAANFGLGTNPVTVSDVLNATVNQAGLKYMGLVRMRSGVDALTVNGTIAAGVTTLTAGAKSVTSIRLGANTSTNYCPVTIYEIALIDSTDDMILQAAVDQMAARHSVAGPIITPFIEGDARIFGDSIASGVAASTVPQHVLGGALYNLICTRNNSATAGAQMSPTGLVSPADDAAINASFSRITATAGLYTGMGLILVHFGTNDFNKNVPIGVIADATEATFYGAMRVGFDAVASNAPTTPILVTLPFYRSGDATPNGAGHTMQDYRNAIAAVCAARGIPYVDLGGLWNAGNVGTYTTDGLHPNDAGHALGIPVVQAAIQALP